MASIEKRVAVTPTTRTRIVLERYSRITGKPMCRLITELLDESTPVLVDMLDTLEKAKNKPKIAIQTAQAYAQRAHGQIDVVQQELDGLFKKKAGRKPKGTRCKT
jgi:hypothetical protein